MIRSVVRASRVAFLVLLLSGCYGPGPGKQLDDPPPPAAPAAPRAVPATAPSTLFRAPWRDGADWTDWWRLNRDEILGVKAAVKAMQKKVSTKSSPFFFGGGSGATAPGGSDIVPSGEVYDRISGNRFVDPREVPLATFSIDVDTASYANVRRMLVADRKPPPGAVRIEEMLNYFTYEYPEPGDDRPFAAVTEVAECPWAPTHSLLHVGIQGRRMDDANVPPRNLVFLVDVSGSMGSSDKLPLVQGGLRLLVDQLRAEDRVAIVVYAGATGVVLPPTSGRDRGEIVYALERLHSGGSTNGGAGIRAAYDLAMRHFDPNGINRVILATDGDFNVGTTSREALVALVERRRETGIFLTVLGVGGGNLKDSQMEELADRGNGNYHYLDSLAEARRVLVEEAAGTLVTVAKDVKIQVEFNPARVAAYRLIGYENRLLDAEDFADDLVDAGEVGAGHSVTALFEIVPVGEPVDRDLAAEAGDGDRDGDEIPLRYDPRSPPEPDELLTLKLRYKEPDGFDSRLLTFPVRDPGNVNWTSTSGDYRFAAAVAAFGMLLRDSEFSGEADYDLVSQIAQTAAGDDPRREEFLGLVDTARRRASEGGGER